MLGVNGKNTVKKGEIVFKQGEPVRQIGLILSGRVIVQNEYLRLNILNGCFIALNEIHNDKYTATYIAADDCVIFALPANNGEESIRNIISKSQDYRAIMITSQFKYVVDVSNLVNDLYQRVERFYEFAKKSYEQYISLCNAFGIQVLTLNELDTLESYESMINDIYDDRLEYFKEGAKIPLAATKLYFSYSEEMAFLQVNEVISMVTSYMEECSSMVDYLRNLLDITGLRSMNNLFEVIYIRAMDIRKKEEVPIEMQVLASGVMEELKFQYNALRKHVNSLQEWDVSGMESKIKELSSEEYIKNEQKTKADKEAEIARDVASLKNSMEQVIQYAAIDEDDANILKQNIDFLVNTPDRLSVEDSVKKAKKAITPIVFKMYLQCYRQFRKQMVLPPKAVELFLSFGYLDERLLDNEHLEFLCSVDYEKNEGPCNVYTMVEWLTMISEGLREPSKSEFDEDYEENLRSLRKQGEITEKQQKEMLEDMDRRVEYEIQNMQKTNSRVLYGQPTAYMPVLYKEAIIGYLDKILVTKKKINESVMKLVKTDYSVFYREIIYSNTKLKLSNEVVMKEIYPDVILFPIFGVNAVMWQEIGTKSRTTPARFCFPIMTNVSIDEMMIKTFGRYRWEICRCMQGMAWNDVKVKSLTSEYMDYIQFYRKNRELSDDAKEKMKLQIQKGRNNSREIFLIDYEAWIKSESNGSMKLNKFVRELMATYCPFEKSIREKLAVQRPYEIAMARNIRNNLKKAQEFDLKIKAIQKTISEVPEEISDTYSFYAEN